LIVVHSKANIGKRLKTDSVKFIGGLQVKSCLLFKLILGVFFIMITSGISLSDEHSLDFSKVPVKGMVDYGGFGSQKMYLL